MILTVSCKSFAKVLRSSLRIQKTPEKLFFRHKSPGYSPRVLPKTTLKRLRKDYERTTTDPTHQPNLSVTPTWFLHDLYESYISSLMFRCPKRVLNQRNQRKGNFDQDRDLKVNKSLILWHILMCAPNWSNSNRESPLSSSRLDTRDFSFRSSDRPRSLSKENFWLPLAQEILEPKIASLWIPKFAVS